MGLICCADREEPWLADSTGWESGAIADPSPQDRMYRKVMDITGGDPLPYGVGPNRDMLSTLLDYVVRQHVLPAPAEPEPVFLDFPFAAGTLGLTG